MEKRPKLFAREATGLVRQFGTFHLAGINWSNMTLPGSLFFFLSFGYLFPTANFLLSLVLSIICFIPLLVLYAFTTAHVARSGGDYVFISRVLHPSLGVMLLFTFCLWFGWWSGAYLNWVFTLGLSPTLEAIGYLIKNTTLETLSAFFLEPLNIIGLGYLLLFVFVLIALFKPRINAFLVSVLISLGFVSLFVIGYLLLSSSSLAFRSAFDNFSSFFIKEQDYYSIILSSAINAGLYKNAPSPFASTFYMLPFGTYIFLYVSAMQVVGGEVKNHKKTPLYAALLTIFVAAGFSIFVIEGVAHTIGFEFNNAANFDYYNGNYLLPIAPSYYFFASLLTHNVIVLTFVFIGIVAQYVALIPLYYLIVPRYLLAGSFDRILPEKLSNVSERFHSPYVSIFVATLAPLVVLPIYTYYQTVLSSLSAVVGELLFGYLIFAIAATLSSFSKKATLFDLRSAWISLLGSLTIVVLIINGYLLLSNPAYGSNSVPSLISVTGVATLGPLVYLLRKVWLRKKGIELANVFSEIPPE
jgi:APA family basic amino acid/polyamine antiporter